MALEASKAHGYYLYWVRSVHATEDGRLMMVRTWSEEWDMMKEKGKGCHAKGAQAAVESNKSSETGVVGPVCFRPEREKKRENEREKREVFLFVVDKEIVEINISWLHHSPISILSSLHC